MPLIYRLIFALVVCVGISDAFTANRTPFSSRRCDERVQLAKDEPEFAKQIVKTIGVLTLGSILAFSASHASANAPPVDASMPFLSSSMQLAIQVKTMDMSMPSSYDAIAGSKSTGASLSKEIERTGTMPTNKVQREEKGPSLVSTVLPSMSKSAKKTPKAAKVQVEKEDKEDKKFEKLKIVDMDMPSYLAPAKEKSAFSL